MSRRASRVLALALLLVGLALANGAHAPAQPARPDIVLILTDDQRWDSLDAMPTVQSELVGPGITFTNVFVANPMCCPSRATILTGLHSHTTHVYRNGAPFGGWVSFKDDSTVATWLHDAGYRTAYVGKYMNGYRDLKVVPPGWDRWFGYERGYYGYGVSDGGRRLDFGSGAAAYSTDVLTREAVSFLEAPSRRPLFLVYAPYAPHAPATPALRHLAAFPAVTPFRPASYNEADVGDKPVWVRRKKPMSPEGQARMDELARGTKQSLLAVDDGVGQLLDALRRTGRLANTLVVYTSDNGLLWGEHRWADMKAAPYEESIRVPLVVRWDELGRRPGVEERLATNLDLAPTFADAAGVETPTVEGRTLMPLLEGGATQWRNRLLLEHLPAPRDRSRAVPAYCGMRAETWKYVVYETHEEELYDLVADPYELENVARDPAHHGTLVELRRAVRQLCDPSPPRFPLTWLCTHETSPGVTAVYGSERRDTLCGGPADEALFGREKADLLLGRGGHDVLGGGTGPDTLVGGAGDDTIRAGDGWRDVVRCGAGRDVVYADAKDAVARTCERVLRPPRRD